MWNDYNNPGHHGPPSAGAHPPPGGPPGGYGSGYNPSYAPLPGPPPGGYRPPPGPPSSAYGPPLGGPPSGPPPGPPYPGYGPPPGPPPAANVYAPPAPPPGPPPADRGYHHGQHHHQQPAQGGGYPGQYSGSHPGQHGSYGAPSGAPPMPPSQAQHYGPYFQGANHQQQQPFFQYSQCNGRRKALCIGINYLGQQGELGGCINDAHNIQRFLCSQFGYKQADIVMLTDDSRDPRSIPTRDNILHAMSWLVRDAAPNDSLFFHYSGHGGQTPDLDGDEADGYDEVIYPVDYDRNGHIVDDLMHEIMVKPLPPGCRLTAIFDSCHSGSALDLPYVYSTEGKIKEPNIAAEAGQGLLSAVGAYARGDVRGVFQSAVGLVKTAGGSSQKAERYARATRTSPADVISWSGCKDSQTSADTEEAGRATGAMSYAFIAALGQNPTQTYQQLLNSIRNILRSKYEQKPQLSSSHPIDVNLRFIC